MGYPPKDGLPQLEKPSLCNWTGFPKLEPGASEPVSHGHTSLQNRDFSAAVGGPGKPGAGGERSPSRDIHGEQTALRLHTPFQPTPAWGWGGPPGPLQGPTVLADRTETLTESQSPVSQSPGPSATGCGVRALACPTLARH